MLHLELILSVTFDSLLLLTITRRDIPEIKLGRRFAGFAYIIHTYIRIFAFEKCACTCAFAYTWRICVRNCVHLGICVESNVQCVVRRKQNTDSGSEYVVVGKARGVA